MKDGHGAAPLTRKMKSGDGKNNEDQDGTRHNVYFMWGHLPQKASICAHTSSYFSFRPDLILNAVVFCTKSFRYNVVRVVLLLFGVVTLEENPP